MKKVVKTGILLFGFVAIVIGNGSVTKAGGDDKVLVNHRQGNDGATKVICVSVNALEAHLGHGDSVVETDAPAGI